MRIGRVGRTVGLRGSFLVSGRSDLIPSYYQTIVVGPDPTASSAKTLTIEERGVRSGRSLLRVREVSTADEARALVHVPLWIRRRDILDSADVAYLFGDLIGRRVVDCVGSPVGHVAEVSNFGAGDIATIVGDRATLGVSQIDLPIHRDVFDLVSLSDLAHPCRIRWTMHELTSYAADTGSVGLA